MSGVGKHHDNWEDHVNRSIHLEREKKHHIGWEEHVEGKAFSNMYKASRCSERILTRNVGKKERARRFTNEPIGHLCDCPARQTLRANGFLRIACNVPLGLVGLGCRKEVSLYLTYSSSIGVY